MSEKSPKPPQSKPVETLEDAVYRSSLSESNKALKGTNPWISIPTTIGTYALAAYLVFLVATKTDAGKEAIKKTIGLDLIDEGDKDKKDEEDLPPPPPPAPPPPAAAPMREEIKDAPAPPPPSDQELVPDEAPKEMPKIDYSMSLGRTNVDLNAIVGGAGQPGGTAAPIGAYGGQQSSSTSIHDMAFNNTMIKVRPPSPPYPPMAKAARQQGSVTVELVIGTDGVPISAKASGGNALLHKPSEEYAMKWRFHPAMEDGRPVQARFKINIVWKI
jgi:protein TonB